MALLPLPHGLLAAETNVSAMLFGGCLAAGLILTAIGTWQRSLVKGLVATGKRTTAQAVDSVLHTSDQGHERHHIVWRFETEDGTLVEHEGLAGALHKPSGDETARIIYDPADPHNARLSTVAERTLSWALFFGTGVALLVVALISGIVAAVT